MLFLFSYNINIIEHKVTKLKDLTIEFNKKEIDKGKIIVN